MDAVDAVDAVVSGISGVSGIRVSADGLFWLLDGNDSV
jgi:hypothetical protein